MNLFLSVSRSLSSKPFCFSDSSNSSLVRTPNLSLWIGPTETSMEPWNVRYIVKCPIHRYIYDPAVSRRGSRCAIRSLIQNIKNLFPFSIFNHFCESHFDKWFYFNESRLYPNRYKNIYGFWQSDSSNPYPRSPVLNSKYQYCRLVTLFEPTFYLTFVITMR